jgi:hypothetical protein
VSLWADRRGVNDWSGHPPGRGKSAQVDRGVLPMLKFQSRVARLNTTSPMTRRRIRRALFIALGVLVLIA